MPTLPYSQQGAIVRVRQQHPTFACANAPTMGGRALVCLEASLPPPCRDCERHLTILEGGHRVDFACIALTRTVPILWLW
jgi:hypothetical protein